MQNGDSSPRRRPPVGKVLVTVIFLLLALGSAGILVGYAEAQNGREALVTAVRAIADKNFDEATTALGEVATHMQRAHIAFAGAAWLRPVPRVGRAVRAASDVTLAAGETASALRDAVGLASSLGKIVDNLKASRPKGNFSFASLTSQERAAVGSALVRASVVVQSGNAKIQNARVRLGRIPGDTGVQGLDDARSVLLLTLRELEDRLGPLSVATLLAPRLAGFPEPTTSLVLFLNNHELRPGGGFIGTYGLVTTYGGQIQKFETRDSYHLDRAAGHTGIAPPLPLQKYLGLKEWFFRDANWSPDFPTSAETTLKFFELESAKASSSTPPTPTFVFGITPNVVAELLKIVGPITVDTSTFTSTNIADELEYQVEKGFKDKGVPFLQRKEILARFADILLTRLTALPFDEWVKIAGLLSDQAKEKQLMAYAREPGLERLLDDLGVTGRIPQTDGDFLMVVDANLGALKSDPVVKRAIHYETYQGSNGNWYANVILKYTHTGSPSWKISRYRSYVRIYVPRGSTLVSVSGGEDVSYGDELGRAVFGAWFTLATGKEKTITFTFKPRQDLFTTKQPYRLTVAKQLGGWVSDLTLRLGFDTKVILADPSEDIVKFGDNRYEHVGRLREDERFEVRFK